jgi:hypothetical protein
MKLKDWADKQGISYLTAWRWFKAGDPRLVNAYQSDSGTIIVPEESTSEQPMSNIQDSDIMSVILKKTVEFSKNQYAIEDFTAWILSNFTLKVKGNTDSPKYSRVKPKSEEVQNHFKQFLKPKGEKPKPNMFVTSDAEALDDLVSKSDDLTAQELVEEIHKVGAEGGGFVNPTDAPEVEELMKDISSVITVPPTYLGGVKTYDNIAEGVVMRSVDLTPQQLNYTGSSNSAFGNNFNYSNSIADVNMSLVNNTSSASVFNVSTFQPTQKEIESVSRVTEIVEKPKRGRKSLKNLGNK